MKRVRHRELLSAFPFVARLPLRAKRSRQVHRPIPLTNGNCTETELPTRRVRQQSDSGRWRGSRAPTFREQARLDAVPFARQAGPHSGALLTGGRELTVGK